MASRNVKSRRKQERKRRHKIAKRLMAYSAAAGGAMLVAGRADASVVYTDLATPILVNNAAGNVFLDLNGDGQDDVLFQHYYFGGSKATGRVMTAGGGAWGAHPNLYGSGQIKSDLYVFYQASQMARAGDSINSGYGMVDTFAYTSIQYVSGGINYASQSHPPGRRWVSASAGSVGEGYLGIAFEAADGLHYGWIRMQVELNNSPTLSNVPGDQPVGWAPEFPSPSSTGTDNAGQMRIFDFAYESTPGVGILAGDTGPVEEATVPEPASLGLLALGAIGLVGLASRRRRKA